LLCHLAGCGGAPAGVARAYALSCGVPGQDGFSNRALSIVDPTTWTIVRSVAIGGKGPAFLSVDPQGRPWVSHHGPDATPDGTVEVFSPAGDKLAEVATCAAGHRAVFVHGDGWVACEANGFVGALARINLSTLAASAPLPLSFPGSDAFTVTAAAVVGGLVVVAGGINGGSGLLFADPTQAVALTALIVGPGISVVEILATPSKVLLLNSISGIVRPPGSAPDVVELPVNGSPSFALTNLSIAPSPRAGVVVGDELYLYSSGAGAPRATLARRSLSTGATSLWPSALTGTVDQLAAHGAAIFLTHQETTSDAADGIYEVDPNSGALTRRLSLPDVSDLVVLPAPSGI
jgi:hypothetical protein